MVYAIFSNGNLKLFDSVQNSFNAGAVFSCIVNSEKIDSKYYNRKLEIQFWENNNTSNAINLNYGKWKLYNKKLTFEIGDIIKNDVKRISIIDSYGQIDSISIQFGGITESNIIRTINNKLKELSSYNSWDEYNLKKENEALRKELEALKNNK
ncbi:MAG: hypothetical protein Q8928_01480 [Bacteroidota bacterium]|nr:hypothetical protein [Bacteroidota bacterium]